MSFSIKRVHERPPRRERIRRILGPIFVVSVFVILGGAISLAALAAWVSHDLPNPNTLLDRTVAQSTKIYDRTGTHVLYDIHGNQSRTLVKLTDLPDYAKWATISVEDKNFYQHHGFVFQSILRAMLANVFRGARAQGASTITQQFVKNAILTNEKTFVRKIKELVLSVEIENRFSKDEILQLYFNEIPYGGSNYGIEAASQNYFGKSAHDLTVSEAATLAALPQSPSTYLANPDKLLARRNLILDLMVDQNYLTGDAATTAKKDPLGVRQHFDNNIVAPHFVLWVRDQLTQLYGERLVETGGLKVVTTLDVDKQKAAEAAIATGIKKVDAMGGANAALVSMDPKTGQVLAMVGSRDFFGDPLPKGCTPGVSCRFDPRVNIALRSRQPGSSFKPIVYAASFVKGYTPSTILDDVVTTFKTVMGDYAPHNYDNKEHGFVTVRQALAGSLNIPAVKMIYLVGIDRVLDLADQLGYTTLADRSRFGLSLVLGGGEVKLLEHVHTFSVFANEGISHDTVSILKVQDAQGSVLNEWKEDNGQQVLDTEVTRELSSVLSDNNARAYIFGAANHMTLADRPVAAKTGTTNDYHDAWTLGYTPSLVAGVWVGNNDNHEMSRGADGSVVAAPIWQSYMAAALKGTTPEKFIDPQTVVTSKPVLDGQLGGETISIDRASGLRATPNTPQNWIEQKVFTSPHTILYYVNKDDPRGPIPTDPTSDPQYASWELAVQQWAQKNNIVAATPPEGFDNVHILENNPQLSVLDPGEGSVISSATINVTLLTSAPRGVSRVTYAIDGVLVDTHASPSLGGSLNLPFGLVSGAHTLTVTAFDDIDNSTATNTHFTYNH